MPVDRTELLARAVLEATAALEEKEAHIRELAPRAAVADELMDATGLLSLQELAKALGWGPNILFRDLRRLGVLQSNRLPYQRYAHHFEVKLGTYRHPKTGETMPTHRPYARPSAIPFFRRKLAGLEQSLDLEVAS
nr:phage antirepressor KilAC domain-containing protein [Dietzia cercidiphylli]